MTTLPRAESALVSPELKTTSLIVAERFGKRHDNVVRLIKALKVPKDFQLLNFEELSREQIVHNGVVRKFPYYELTRDGFALLVMGFTGRRAMAWKIKFLEAFNLMEAELLAPILTKKRAIHYSCVESEKKKWRRP